MAGSHRRQTALLPAQVAAEALHTGAQMVHVIRPQPPAQPTAKLQVRSDLTQTLFLKHSF